MNDILVETEGRRPYHLPMEDRVARLESDMEGVKSVLSRLEPMIVRIDATLTSTLPNLATKAELADMRSELKSDIAGLRTEVTKDISGIRTEVAREISGLRADVSNEISGFRIDVSNEISGFRTDVSKDTSGFRAEVSKEISVMRVDVAKEISGLRNEMTLRFADVPTKTYLWGILGVLITAYGAALAALVVIK